MNTTHLFTGTDFSRRQKLLHLLHGSIEGQKLKQTNGFVLPACMCTVVTNTQHSQTSQRLQGPTAYRLHMLTDSKDQLDGSQTQIKNCSGRLKSHNSCTQD